MKQMLKIKNYDCGNSGTCITQYKSWNKLLEIAQNYRTCNKRAKSAYFIKNYTQQMCEMKPAEFVKHVINNGKLIFIKK